MTILAKLRARAGLDGTYARTKPAPPHGSMIVQGNRMTHWFAPAKWLPSFKTDDDHPVTRMRLAGMFWHEGA